MSINRGVSFLAATSIALMLAACATPPNPMHQEAMALVGTGNYESGVAKLEQLVAANPENRRYRIDLVNARANYVNRLVASADVERVAGRLDAARVLYKQAQSMDPSSDRVRQGQEELRRDDRHAEVVKASRVAFDKGDLDGALGRLQTVLGENPLNVQALELKGQVDDKRARALMASPQLESAFRKPVNLEFRDATVRVVFDALSRSTGINYILDKDIRPDLKTTVFTRLAPLEDAIDLILMTNQLEKKVLNQNTILIYPATQQKLKEYQDLVVKGFYLTSADVKQVQAVLKSMLKIREVSIDEKLRLVVVRDTPEAVRLAEKMIAMHDLGEPEVMLELEVLEVRRGRLLDLGIQWPDQLTLTPLPSTGTTVTLNDLRNVSSNRIGASLASTIVNLKKQDGDVNLLANPRIRAKNREKAKILIGDRVPVITSNATSTGFISQSVQYLDVGLKLEIEPDIQLDREVGMKVALEVSSITREITTSTGLLAYQVGTRNASTSLRLKDGDTQILAGLINDEDRRTANRIPGLGDLPVVGRLFGSQRDDNQKTEIVLSITPRLVRGLTRPDTMASEFWSGTETKPSTRPLSLGVVASIAGKPGIASAVGTAAVAGNAQGTSQALFFWKGPGTVKVGEEFKVDLLMKSERPLRSLPLQLSFDPATLEVVRIEEGEFFKRGGVKTNFAHNIDQTNGRVFVGLSRAGAEGAKGEGGLVSVVFKSKVAKSGSEVRLIAATPVTFGAGAVTVTLPKPQVVSVNQ
jgi:general secretion pathway protein D